MKSLEIIFSFSIIQGKYIMNLEIVVIYKL